MSKTNKKFDWEVYDNKTDELVDVLTMTRDEAKAYKKQFPQYSLTEVDYSSL